MSGGGWEREGRGKVVGRGSAREKSMRGGMCGAV